MKKYFLIIMVLFMPYISVAQPAISNIVVPVSYFVNHVKQLTLVKNNLIKYRQASLVGVSGMGKTQLARMYAYENRDNYDLIWFIDCNLDINEEFLKLAKLINEKAKTNLILEELSSVKKEVLSYLSSKNKWLLVFDNLKIKENHKVQEFIDWENNGHVVFVSQESELLPNIVKMTAFEKSDATTLAKNVLEKANPELAEFLVQEFTGYPILIVQGAQLLNQVPGLDKEAYKRKIKQSTDKIKLNITLAINELTPSAKRLLNKIALINNQAFSKDLLRIITDNQHQNLLDDDIYQLSKFALIANIDRNATNPIFEMHDVISQKIAEINGHNNKTYLQTIVVQLVNAVPNCTINAHSFRNANTVSENLEIILKNSEKYSLNIYKLLELNLQLIAYYKDSLSHYDTAKKVQWFNQVDQQGKFKLWLMNNDEKRVYARYLQSIGGYYRSCSNNRKAIEYYTKATKVFDNIKGYEVSKWNLFFSLAMTNVALGFVQEAEKNIQVMEQIFNKCLIDKNDIGFMYFVKAQLLFIQGNYSESLEQINKTITTCINTGLHSDDLVFIGPYILKAEIFNILGQYKEALIQVEQLYNMCQLSKGESHEVFGRIFTQMSRAKLGIGNAEEALEYASQAKTIFINDPSRSNKNLVSSSDTELAKAFFAEGDALTSLGQNEKAVHSYLAAEMLYWNNYKDNMKNVDEVSKMYFAAAKASCHLAEKGWYIKFHDQHISKFGADHPRSIEIFKMDSICYPESQR